MTPLPPGVTREGADELKRAWNELTAAILAGATAVGEENVRAAKDYMHGAVDSFPERPEIEGDPSPDEVSLALATEAGDLVQLASRRLNAVLDAALPSGEEQG